MIYVYRHLIQLNRLISQRLFPVVCLKFRHQTEKKITLSWSYCLHIPGIHAKPIKHGLYRYKQSHSTDNYSASLLVKLITWIIISG